MSGSVPPPPPPPGSPPPGPPPSQASVLGPGIAGLLVQGIETGLVFAEFSRWFYRPGRRENFMSSTVVIFVTIIGLAQSGICFSSAWNKYVLNFGMDPCQDWVDYVQAIPTLAISAPVQAFMILRCYHLVNKNMAIITPLVLLLLASFIMSLWAIVITFHYVDILTSKNPALLLQLAGISWPYLLSILIPSVLDIALTGILLYHFTRTMKQVFAAHTRKRIFRLANIVWQSALPPTLCAICMSALYIRFGIAPQRALQFWLPNIQAMIGKLYVLSLIYLINAWPLETDEHSTAFMSTFTIPMEVMHTHARESRGGDDTCGEIVAPEYGSASTIEFAV